MQYLAPPSGKTEHLTESSDSLLHSPNKDLSDGVIYFSVAVPVFEVAHA